MLLLKVPAASESYYKTIIAKFKRVRMKYPLHVDVIRKNKCVYVSSLDDGFSAAFVCQAYLKAKENNLDADLLYARHIDLEYLPEEVKKISEKWSQRKLSKREIMQLRNISITEHILGRW